MEKFDAFYFESYDFDYENLIAKFYYSFDSKEFFTEEIDFSNSNIKIRSDLNSSIVENFLFSIHIALWISYYKAFPTKKLYIKSWYLSKDQIKFWKKFYKNWLWEFLYTNKISPDWLFDFENKLSEKNIDPSILDFNQSEKSLIPLWWGKDSLVSIDMYEKSDFLYDLYVFWKTDPIKQNCADILWKEILLTKRKISDNLIKLNNQWYYNWHVPITWIIAFVMLLEAYLYDYKYLVLSNEKSANVWNTIWNWFEINHQWSKSLDFEKDFNSYIRNNLSSNICYFSLLRGFYEYNIAKYFTNNCSRFFWIFSSCNNNFKIDEDKRLKNTFWCNSCPKCAFSFVILRPFLNTKQVFDIFWEDLLFKNDLENTFLELLWIDWIKPFECVWELEEVVLSFYKIYNLYEEKPNILKIFKQKILDNFSEEYFKNLEKKLWTIYDEDIIPWVIKKTLISDITK